MSHHIIGMFTVICLTGFSVYGAGGELDLYNTYSPGKRVSSSPEHVSEPVVSSNEPTKPVMKTIVGLQLTVGGLSTMALGAAAIIRSNEKSDPHGLANVLGKILLVGGGCALIPGGILLGVSIHDWHIYNEWEKDGAGERQASYGLNVTVGF